MIKSITFKEDFRCFRRGEQFAFLPGINLLVGDQGTGKSSLLAAMIRHGNTTIDFEKDGDVNYSFFDFEKDNPRKKPYVDSAIDVLCRFRSHGEIVNDILSHLKELGNHIFITDEPDMALSIRSIHQLIGMMDEAVKRKCQIIMTAHNPILIASQKQVLSLEHRKWMSSKKYIDSQKRPMTREAMRRMRPVDSN